MMYYTNKNSQLKTKGRPMFFGDDEREEEEKKIGDGAGEGTTEEAGE